MSQLLKRLQAHLVTLPRNIRTVILLVALAVLIFASITISLPDNEIRVVSFEPTGQTERLGNITIKFSKPMVPTDSLDKPVLNPPVTFTPAIRGLARWVETDVLRFFPDAELLPATEYQAQVKSDKTWASGLKIVSKDIFRFRTPGLSLTGSNTFSEPDPENPGATHVIARMTFNYPVNIEDVRKNLTIRGENAPSQKTLGFSLRPVGQPDYVPPSQSTKPQEPLFAADFELITDAVPQKKGVQQYTIYIEKGLQCESCGFALAQPIRIPFDVQALQPLVVNSAWPNTETEQPTINIDFSAPIDLEQAKKYITVEPNIDFGLDVGYSNVILRGPFVPNQTYTVTVSKDMPSRTGQTLGKEFSTRILIPELQPSVSFTSRGVYLPRGGNGLMEIKSINIDKIEVEVEQIFANNLVYFLTAGYGGYEDYYWDNRTNQLGRSLFIKDKILEYVQNQPLLTTIDVKGIIGDKLSGVYKVSARSKERRWTGDSRYVMVTDIGLSARFGENYLMVWANSLTSAQPISGATITLISRNNQTLLQGKTDGRGIAVFENIKDKLTGFEPFVITAERQNDLSYLRLDETILPTSDFDVAGRPYVVTGYEAFLYTDRGVYRPGDTVHVVSVVRGPKASMPPAFPYFLTVYDTRGKKFTNFRVSTEGTGMVAQDIVIPNYAATGRYSVAAMIGEDLQIGRVEFLVEEFMPDRIKVALTTPKSVYRAGDTIRAAVDAKLLFGPPAANYQVSGHLTMEPTAFSPSGWSGYSFTNNEITFNKMEVTLRDTLLNDTGGYTYVYEIPKQLTPPSMLKGLLSTVVSEPGGRGVGAYTELQIHPYERYVGIKLSQEGYAKIGQPTEAKLVAVGIDGKAVPLDQCAVRFNRIVYNTLLKKDKTGAYRWVSERKIVALDSTKVAVTATGASVSFTPSDYGSYEIVARDSKGGHSAAIEFYASGWGYAPWALNNPDRIELGLDKKTYAAGDKAKLQIRAPFGGKLYLTVEQTGVVNVITRDMAENTAEIEIPVKSEYLPNVYITAAVVRSADSLEPNMPARAFGLIPLMVSNAEKRIVIAITAPEVIKPKTKVTVGVRLPQAKGADVTIAAVDAGILQLTDFKAPDPMDFFFGKKQPYLKPYDLYSFLYPHVNQAKSHLSPSGDKMFAASRMRHLNPITARRVKSVALWSGLLKTDKSGAASVTFDVPEFNGKLIIMAVTAQNDRFGSASKEMTIRDNIVIQENLPRFVSPNDQFDGLVTVFNNTGAKADIAVTMAITGPVGFDGPSTITVPIENNREGSATFKLKALQAPGVVSFKITASAGADHSEANVELPNRPALPIITKYGSGFITKASPAQFTFPGDWVPTTDQYVLQTSAMPAVSFKRNIQYLLAYPYGCVEQTTSRLFPLLYYNDLVKVVEPSLVGGQAPAYFIQEGITKLQSMMLPDGSFAFWPGGTTSNIWSSIYASHFLSEASKAGYQIDKKVLQQVYDRLADIASGRRNIGDLTDAHRIYAAYVLAQAGKLEQRMVNYLKVVDAKQLQAHSRFLLAGSLALAGDMPDATKLMPVDVQPNIFEPETGGDFNSGVRTDAIQLEVLQQITPGSPSVDALAASLMKRAEAGEWYTTQENAWALMALGKYLKKKSNLGFAGTIAVQGDKNYPFDSTGFKFQRKDLANKQVSLSIATGDGTCFFYWQASGISSGNVAPEFDRGLRVRRQYLDENAKPLDVKNVHLGDRIICVITAEALQKPLLNVVINDLLPAGFEIENPRLKTTPRLSWIPQEGSPIDYQDIRDDRLLVFTNLYPNSPAKFFYSLRAICAGDFKVPPIAAEAMYNPLMASSSGSGAVVISK